MSMMIAPGRFASGYVSLPFAYTVLLIEGKGASGATTVVDESAKLHGLGTPNGNVSIATSSPAPSVGTGTIAFDGSGDWLEWADHADWSIGSSDFTLTAIFSLKAANINTGDQTLIGHYDATPTQRGWALTYDATNKRFVFRISTDGTVLGGIEILVASFSPTADTPYFGLVTRSGSSWRMHLGPVSAGTAPLVASATSSLSIFDSSAVLTVGKNGNTSPGPAEYFDGNINTLALAVGYAWQASDANATIPTTSFPRGTYTDPYWPWVAFLSGFEASNGATTFTDEGPLAKTITTAGNAQATTTSPLVGTSSLLLDGSGDYVSLPASADLSVSPGDCTFEARVRITSLAHNNTIFSKRTATPIWQLWIKTTGALELLLWDSGASTVLTLTSASSLIAINTEYKVAMSREGSTYYLAINGTVVATGTPSGTPALGNIPLSIGRDGSTAGREVEGKVDEVRITRWARFNANYTPTSGAFPRG